MNPNGWLNDVWVKGELIEGEEGVEGQQAPAMGFAAGLMMKALIHLYSMDSIALKKLFLKRTILDFHNVIWNVFF